MEVSERGRRRLRRLGVVVTCLVFPSGVAAAHGTPGQAGETVAFAVVLGLPILAGLAGGTLAIRGLRVASAAQSGHRWGVVLGVSLVVLGVTFAASAVATSRSLGLAAGAVGAVFALWVSRGDEPANRWCHTDLALGAISAHRLLEGLAIGALYSAGAALGLLGAVLLVGHTALETAAVGGMYARGDARTRAVGAILLVQASYAVGAAAGLGVAAALPASARALALAVAGGALLVVGVGETERSITARRPATA